LTGDVPPARATFPEEFVFGVATSAFQIEGGVALDSRGPSIWDAFCATPGHVRGDADARVATDHRRRMPADVALLRTLGIRAYRFSVAWPRVQPDGCGRVSQSGLDFYRALVDALLDAGIAPVATLYHWDLPLALEEQGGWPVRDTAGRFADYARVVGTALGDRVARWSTLNEPWCASMLGYAAGAHAPGRREPMAAVAASHHLLLAHGLAVDALRGSSARDAAIGITLNPYPVVVAGERVEDQDAARRVDGVANRLWYDAVLRGRYPDDVLEDFARVSDLCHIRDGDLEQIARPIDALGLNYYRRHHVRFMPGASARGARASWPGSPDVELVQPPGPVTAGGWAVEPLGLYDALVRLAREYTTPPLYVDEYGAAFADPPDADGAVDDRDRIASLDAHLRAAHRAIHDGVDLRGFFVWSFLDNFEWAEGYAHRFGLVHVDFETLERRPKASARWYARVVRERALPAPTEPGPSAAAPRP
jgi:beta-glucosidase